MLSKAQGNGLDWNNGPHDVSQTQAPI